MLPNGSVCYQAIVSQANILRRKASNVVHNVCVNCNKYQQYILDSGYNAINFNTECIEQISSQENSAMQLTLKLNPT